MAALAVVYSTSEERRDEPKTGIHGDLKGMGILKRDFLPYRRGCKQFEKVLGDRHAWQVGEKRVYSYGEKLGYFNCEVHVHPAPKEAGSL